MTQRRQIRELAMQVLFAWDAHGQMESTEAELIAQTQAADGQVRAEGLRWACGVWEARAVLDAWIERLAPQWPTRRQPGVDRALLRLAVWELTHGDTPPKVILDEAIELAKAFSTGQSAAFVNGVLDAVLKEHEALIAGLPSEVRGMKADSQTAAGESTFEATSSKLEHDPPTAGSTAG